MNNDYKLILKMIEEVGPKDTEKLDEIDALTYTFFTGKECHKTQYGYKPIYAFSLPNGCDREIPHYTRSRDALKAIRPEGWIIDISTHIGMTAMCWVEKNEFGGVKIESIRLPTEELAELYAIIQAISYERGLTKDE